MPNHIHAIVVLNDNDIYYEDPYMQQRAVNPSERGNGYEKRHVTLLSRYVNSLKGAVTKYARPYNLRPNLRYPHFRNPLFWAFAFRLVAALKSKRNAGPVALRCGCVWDVFVFIL